MQAPRFAGDERLEAACDNIRIMRIGERGEAVKKIQQALIDDGFVMSITTKDGSPDGIYGQETYRTVRQFQVKYGLKYKDGAVGHETMSKLDELYRAG